MGATLEFGFGVDDLIRSMAKSEQGTVVLVLCAALREVYSLDISTEVLLEMARLSGVGGEWMPSSREWKAMLNACSGVLAKTSFGQRAERMMQLGSDGQRLGAFQRLEAAPQDLRDCSSPKSIAEALFAMAAVSRKEMQAVTLVGGPDTGWLAAVADWVLDLRVTVSDAQGDVVLLQQPRPGRRAGPDPLQTAGHRTSGCRSGGKDISCSRRSRRYSAGRLRPRLQPLSPAGWSGRQRCDPHSSRISRS